MTKIESKAYREFSSEWHGSYLTAGPTIDSSFEGSKVFLCLGVSAVTEGVRHWYGGDTLIDAARNACKARNWDMYRTCLLLGSEDILLRDDAKIFWLEFLMRTLCPGEEFGWGNNVKEARNHFYDRIARAAVFLISGEGVEAETEAEVTPEPAQQGTTHLLVGSQSGGIKASYAGSGSVDAMRNAAIIRRSEKVESEIVPVGWTGSVTAESDPFHFWTAHFERTLGDDEDYAYGEDTEEVKKALKRRLALGRVAQEDRTQADTPPVGWTWHPVLTAENFDRLKARITMHPDGSIMTIDGDVGRINGNVAQVNGNIIKVDGHVTGVMGDVSRVRGCITKVDGGS